MMAWHLPPGSAGDVRHGVAWIIGDPDNLCAERLVGDAAKVSRHSHARWDRHSGCVGPQVGPWQSKRNRYDYGAMYTDGGHCTASQNPRRISFVLAIRRSFSSSGSHLPLTTQY